MPISDRKPLPWAPCFGSAPTQARPTSFCWSSSQGFTLVSVLFLSCRSIILPHQSDTAACPGVASLLEQSGLRPSLPGYIHVYLSHDRAGAALLGSLIAFLLLPPFPLENFSSESWLPLPSPSGSGFPLAAAPGFPSAAASSPPLCWGSPAAGTGAPKGITASEVRSGRHARRVCLLRVVWVCTNT